MNKLAIFDYNRCAINIYECKSSNQRDKILSQYNEDEISWMEGNNMQINYE